jgi:hypothetical protein
MVFVFEALKLVILLFATVALAGPANTGLWVWYDALPPQEKSIFTDPTALTELLSFTRSASTPEQRIGTLFLQAQGHMTSADGRAAIVDIMERIHTFDSTIRIGFAYGWSKHYPDASVAATTHAAIAFAVAAADLLPLISPSIPFELIFDVEPDPAHVEQYQELANLLVQLDTATAPFRNRIRLASTSSWAFKDYNVTCDPAFKSEKEISLLDCVAKSTDVSHLMDFRSFVTKGSPPVDGIVPLAAPALQAAVKAKSKVSIIVETNCGLGKYTPKLSFCNRSIANLTATLAAAQAAWEKEGVWSTAIDASMPFAIEDYRGLQALQAV